MIHSTNQSKLFRRPVSNFTASFCVFFRRTNFFLFASVCFSSPNSTSARRSRWTTRRATISWASNRMPRWPPPTICCCMAVASPVPNQPYGTVARWRVVVRKVAVPVVVVLRRRLSTRGPVTHRSWSYRKALDLRSARTRRSSTSCCRSITPISISSKVMVDTRAYTYVNQAVCL
uniref:Uncharacterized protein n=1 Tax=Anopheles maculatus TaxID=74869 RepID=A0A182SLL4_9DIPT